MPIAFLNIEIKAVSKTLRNNLIKKNFDNPNHAAELQGLSMQLDEALRNYNFIEEKQYENVIPYKLIFELTNHPAEIPNVEDLLKPLVKKLKHLIITIKLPVDLINRNDTLLRMDGHVIAITKLLKNLLSQLADAALEGFTFNIDFLGQVKPEKEVPTVKALMDAVPELFQIKTNRLIIKDIMVMSFCEELKTNKNFKILHVTNKENISSKLVSELVQFITNTPSHGLVAIESDIPILKILSASLNNNSLESYQKFISLLAPTTASNISNVSEPRRIVKQIVAEAIHQYCNNHLVASPASTTPCEILTDHIEETTPQMKKRKLEQITESFDFLEELGQEDLNLAFLKK